MKNKKNSIIKISIYSSMIFLYNCYNIAYDPKFIDIEKTAEISSGMNIDNVISILGTPNYSESYYDQNNELTNIHIYNVREKVFNYKRTGNIISSSKKIHNISSTGMNSYAGVDYYPKSPKTVQTNINQNNQDNSLAELEKSLASMGPEPNRYAWIEWELKESKKGLSFDGTNIELISKEKHPTYSEYLTQNNLKDGWKIKAKYRNEFMNSNKQTGNTLPDFESIYYSPDYSLQHANQNDKWTDYNAKLSRINKKIVIATTKSADEDLLEEDSKQEILINNFSYNSVNNPSNYKHGYGDNQRTLKLYYNNGTLIKYEVEN